MGSTRDLLLEWGAQHLRDLPWRRTRDPWRILVAEVMLQQTQVARVVDRWERFLDRFPDPTATAAAPLAAVVREWAGLGYNRRAVGLHRAAASVVEHHAGAVPADLQRLLALPGVGPYTARAVLVFAFERVAAPVDTNVGRVLARLEGTRLTPRGAQSRADELVPADRPWLWNQSLMELGATVCHKRMPACGRCPLVAACAWRGRGDDPALGSAGAGRAQTRFAGSDRQLRGRLVDALRTGPVATDGAPRVTRASPARTERLIEALVADGLVERAGGRLRLVGDAS